MRKFLMKPVCLSTAAVMVVSLAGQAALAANVTDIQGQVQLSRSGGAYRTLAGPSVCNAGDVVRAGKDSSAQVVNPNGIIETVSPGNPVTCKAGPGPLANLPGSSAASSAAASASTSAVAVGGTIAVVAGVAGLLAVTKKSSASP
jgi:hypothetical protein